jgi:hypothetical protein
MNEHLNSFSSDEPWHERAWQQYRRDFPDNYERHLSHPEISVDAYVNDKKLALGQAVARKKRIYLDTKYWLYCLDALSGRPQRPIHMEIARTLARLVEAGDAICPAHYALFVEIANIGNRSRRRELAKLVDWLSGKVTIVPPHVQEQAELLYLIRSFSAKKDDLHPVLHLVWEPISAIVGLAIPILVGVPPEIKTAMQKDWCDLMSNFGLEDLFASGEDELPSPIRMESDLHEYQNEGARTHRHEYRSFDEVFLIELDGVLDACRPMIASAFRHLYVSAGHSLTEKDLKNVDEDTLVRQFCGLIHEAYKQKKLSTQWPSVHIGSGIHASMRYEQRKFQKNDLHDHLHAKAALPYCDMFLTERVLGTLITGKHLRFDQQYSCRVLWNDDDALIALKELLVGNGQVPH